MKTDAEIYKFHVENLREVTFATDSLGLSLRHNLALGKNLEAESLTRIYALLVGVWAEVRLQKILFEPGGFQAARRGLVILCKKQQAKWEMAVKLGFCEHLGVPDNVILNGTATIPVDDIQQKVNKIFSNIDAELTTKLDTAKMAKYQSIIQLIRSDLLYIVELRNKLAHGQLCFILNSKGNDIVQSKIDALNQENNLTLQNKLKLLENLANIIHDLVVTEPTFDRDFVNNYNKIINNRDTIIKFDKVYFADYVTMLKAKKKRIRK